MKRSALEMILRRSKETNTAINDPNINTIILYSNHKIELEDVDDPHSFIVILDYYDIKPRYEKINICRLFMSYEMLVCQDQFGKKIGGFNDHSSYWYVGKIRDLIEKTDSKKLIRRLDDNEAERLITMHNIVCNGRFEIIVIHNFNQ